MDDYLYAFIPMVFFIWLKILKIDKNRFIGE